ncbi:TfpX/TfpZ family type IV pilin accessory protein [Tahibacter amnicola]|uniref:Type IV pilin accessory protein n=1 Tax=Tahibacter amnicola TaxID=2976241 RepID=A0ABY6BEL1_9GAMM|nr:TfpX/TfpZ family type IV pilin accessory protein [Tahibacter amnicola]UXI67693.1 hypothetical protein N4264_23625 [Tahibacter amnicola]
MTTPKPVSRWKAASIHLLLSAMLALSAWLLIFKLWFPPPYFHASGGDRLIVLLVGIDLVVGPLLTLIIFVQGKRGLKFDLAFIGVVQVAALIYGVSVITQSRPVFIVFVVDRFNVVPAHYLDEEDLARGKAPEFRSASWTGPRLVAAPMPTDPKLRTAVLDSSLRGKDLEQMPEYYVDIARERNTIIDRSKPLDELVARNPARNAPIVDEAVRQSGLERSDVGWLPLVAMRSDMAMLINRRTGETIGAIDVDPWEKPPAAPEK